MKAKTLELIKMMLDSDETIAQSTKDKILAVMQEKTYIPKPKLLTQNEAARYLSLSRQTIYQWVKQGILKPAILPSGINSKRGGIKRYRIEDLETLAGIKSDKGE